MVALKQTLWRVTKKVAWAPIAVLILHSVLAEIFGHEPYVDPVIHFLGGAAIAYFVRHAAVIGTQYVGTPSPMGLDLIALGLGSLAACLWEFGEMASDLFLGTNIQKHASNTLRDLALGVSGAAIYLISRRVGAQRAA